MSDKFPKSSLRISSGSNAISDRQIRLNTPLPDLGGTTSDMTQTDVVRKSESALHDILIGSAWYPFHKLRAISVYDELLAEELKALMALEADKNCPWSDPESYDQYISPRLQASTKSEASREPVRCKTNKRNVPEAQPKAKQQPLVKKKTTTPLGNLIEHTIKKTAAKSAKPRSPTSPKQSSLSERLHSAINSSRELDTHYNINDLNDAFLAIKNDMATAKCASEILGMENVLVKLYCKISKPLIRADLYARPLLRQRNHADKVIHIMGPPEAEIRTTVVAYSKSIGAQLFVVSGKISIEQQLTKITRFCSDSPADATIVLLDHCEDHTETFSNHGGTQQMAKELVFLLGSFKHLPIFWVIASQNPFTNIFDRLRSHILPDNCVYCLPPNLISRQIFARKLLEEHYPSCAGQASDTSCTNEDLCKWISEASYLCSFAHIRDFCCMVATKKVEGLTNALFEKISVDDPRLRPTLEDLVSCSYQLSQDNRHIAFTKLDISPYIPVLGAIKLQASRMAPQVRHQTGLIGKRLQESTPNYNQPPTKRPFVMQDQINIENLAQAYQDSRGSVVNFARQPCVPPSTYAHHYQANEQQIVHE